jgi:polysaccharide export outer membrane protein
MVPLRAATVLFILAIALFALAAIAADGRGDYRLGAGDNIRVQVFQNPDLQLETRVSESGLITYPLVGALKLGGRTILEAQGVVADALESGGLVKRPQVNIAVMDVRGSQVAILGQVNTPGRYPLEAPNTRISQILAAAGGIATSGADTVIIVGSRGGVPFRKEIDLPTLFLNGNVEDDIVVTDGDTIYVHRAPVYYIYGEVQKPGMQRVERGMTVRQALAQGGGPTVRGSERRLRLDRRNGDGKMESRVPKPTDEIQPNDVLYVREALF